MKQNRILFFAAIAATFLAGCFGKKQAQAPAPGTSAEPDKVLYDKSANDIKHGRYGVGRLGMQTLINTYPDSEYLAKAKLSIGDSYFKEGGTAGLKQAIVEYKAALAVRDTQSDTRTAAENGVKQPFALPHRADPDADDDKADAPSKTQPAPEAPAQHPQ